MSKLHNVTLIPATGHDHDGTEERFERGRLQAEQSDVIPRPPPTPTPLFGRVKRGVTVNTSAGKTQEFTCAFYEQTATVERQGANEAQDRVRSLSPLIAMLRRLARLGSA